jgi:hypothetical protein
MDLKDYLAVIVGRERNCDKEWKDSDITLKILVSVTD